MPGEVRKGFVELGRGVLLICRLSSNVGLENHHHPSTSHIRRDRSNILSRRHLLLIPFYTILKGHTGASKDIERTSDSEINSAIAQLLDVIQVL